MDQTLLINAMKLRLEECSKHEEKIVSAREHLAQFMPLTAESYFTLDESMSIYVDLLVYRFSKLQDTLGEHIFILFLQLLQENAKKKAFIDILNRLEELDILSVTEWISLRELRNAIAHEYADDPNETVSAINTIYDKSNQLIDIYHRIEQYLKAKGLLAD